jgi:hypothetical protein
VTVADCEKCDQAHDPKKCKGHKNLREDPNDRESRIVGVRPCLLYPVRGLKVCVAHGGNSPNAKAKAAKVVTEQKARKKLGRLNVVPVEDPLTQLQILGGKATAWMDVCEDHMAELERMRYSTEGGEHIRGEVQLFVGALEQCRKVLVDIARLNIDQRLAAIEEEKLNLVTDALGRVLHEMGLSKDQQREARLGLVRHLRVIPGRPSGGRRPAA